MPSYYIGSTSIERININNKIIGKFIKKEEFENYIKLGFVKGRKRKEIKSL